MTAIEEIVTTLQARFPAIGERATQAARLYVLGEVHPLPRTKILKDDRWKIAGYVASITGKYCTCPDADEANAPRHNGGPLCAHRIAAMMYERLGAPASQQPSVETSSAVERLLAIFAEAEAAGAEQVRLRVRVALTWDRDTEQGNTCEGYLLAGEGRVWQELEASHERAEMLGSPAAFSFGLDELEQALDAHGWQYTTKNRSRGGGAATRLGIQGWINEIWYFLPQEERDRKFDPAIRTHIGAVAA